MLTLFRRFKKSIIGALVAGFAVILMVSWGIDARGRGSVRRGSTIDAIRVDDTTFSEHNYEYELARNNEKARAQLGENYNNFRQFLNLEQRTIDMMIEKTLVDRYISELGMTAGLEQIQRHISQYPFFQKFGLTQSTYRQFLNSQGMTGDALEDQARMEISLEQLQATFGDLALPSERELRAVFIRDHTSYEFGTLTFAAKDFESKVALDDTKLQKYFDEHADQFKKPRSVRYAFVRFDPSEFLASVEVTEDDIRERYEQRQGQFAEPKQIRLAKILLKKVSDQPSPLEQLVAPPEKGDKTDKNAAKRETAKLIVDKLRNGESFAALVKEYSEDDATKAQDGDLGWQLVANIDKELRSVADRLESGKYSDVIDTPEGFVIISATEIKERRTKALAEVHDQIKEELQRQDAPEYARVAAEEFLGKWQDQREMPLVEFATKSGRQGVQTGRLLPATEDVPEAAPGLTKALVTLPQGERTSQNVGDVEFVVEILETKDAFIPPFPEVKEAVTKEYVHQQGAVLAKDAATQALSALTTAPPAQPLEELASRFGGTAGSTGAITPKAGGGENEVLAIPEAKRIGFTLTPESPVAPKVIEGNEKYFLLRLKSRTSPAESDFVGKKSEIFDAERNAVRTRMVEALVQTLRGAANIWVSPAILEKKGSQQSADI